MTKLDLIDHIGYGIKRIYQDQVRRYFPLPDYDFSQSRQVKLTIPGSVIDEAYSQNLIANTELPLEDVIALDRVQKKLPITNEEAKSLRQKRLIEGRKPNYHILSRVASQTDMRSQYIKNRPFDDGYYIDLVLKYIDKFKTASHQDIDELLYDKLGDVLSHEQKRNKIRNLLSKMRAEGMIVNVSSKKSPSWQRP